MFRGKAKTPGGYAAKHGGRYGGNTGPSTSGGSFSNGAPRLRGPSGGRNQQALAHIPNKQTFHPGPVTKNGPGGGQIQPANQYGQGPGMQNGQKVDPYPFMQHNPAPEPSNFQRHVGDLQQRHLEGAVDALTKENDMMRLEIKAQNEYHRQLLQSLNFAREELRVSRDTLGRYQSQHASDQRKIHRLQASVSSRDRSGRPDPSAKGVMGVQAHRVSMTRRDGKHLPDRAMTTTPTAGMSQGGGHGNDESTLFGLGELEECRHLSQVMDRIESMSIQDQAASFEQMAPELFAISRIAALGHDLGAVLSTEHVVKVILDGIPELVNVSHVELFLVDPSRPDVVLQQPVTETSARIGYGVEAGGFVGYAVETGELVSSHRPSQDPRVSAEIDRREFDISSLFTVPLKNQGKVIGALHLFNKLRGNFTNTDARIMSRAADLCASAILNARLYETSQRNENRSAALVKIGKELTGELDVNKLLRRILDTSVTLIDADRSALFLVDEENNELRTLLADKVNEIRLPIDVGIVGNVVKTGETLNVADAYADDRFHVDVDKATGYHTSTILCVAIRNQDGKGLGAVEVVNKIGDTQFTQEDQALLESLASICGIAIENSRMHAHTKHDKLKAQSLFQIASELMHDSDVATTISDIISRARNLIEASGSAVWVLDPSSPNEMVRLTPNIDGKDQRFSTSKGIAGHVISTGQTITSTQPSEVDPRFDEDVDSYRGRAPKSVLCMDVRDSQKHPLGCVALFNKQNGGFTKEDEDTLRAFLVFAGIAVSRSQSKFIEHVGNIVFPDTDPSNARSLKRIASSVHIPPSESTAERWLNGEHENEAYLKGKETLSSWEFNLFDFEDDRNMFMMLDIFKALNLIDTFNIPLEKLTHFLYTLRGTYINVPYHNWSHGADVGQTTYALLSANPDAFAMMNDVERLGMLVGALCHDMGHPGLNNAYQIMTRTGIAVIYNDQSVLENYHAARAFSMLSENANNFLENALDLEQYKVFRKTVITVILATDMGRHFDILKAANARIEDGSPLDATKAEDRQLSMQVLMKCADISNVAKPFTLASEWADRLLEEFFRQGDMERASGLPVTPFMDRALVTKPKSQVGFMNFMAVPLFTAASKLFPPMEAQLKQLKDNVGVYQAEIDKEKAEAEAKEGKKEKA